MWKSIAGVVSLTLLVLTGCATGGVTDPPVEPNGDRTVCYHGHRPASTISVVVYVDSAGRVQVVPERAVVEHPNQTVVWTAADGEISNIDFEPSDCAPGPPSINSRGRQISTQIAAGHRGTHKYSFTFHPSSGASQRIDPMIVVEY
ncbi:MAG: hypothetical protein KY432_11410, partial [Acidobacteria bacterium]|nr:hypothetical protein [Acidobacteriota bacterium]